MPRRWSIPKRPASPDRNPDRMARLDPSDFYEHVYALDQVIDVDYYLPGCPPPPDLIASAVNAVIAGDLPPKGSTLAPRKALCDTCPRNKRNPTAWRSSNFKRIHEVEADPNAVFPGAGNHLSGAWRRVPGAGKPASRSIFPAEAASARPGVVGDRTQISVRLGLSDQSRSGR